MALQFEIMAVTPFRQNCTLLWDDATGEAVLTDMGGDAKFVAEEIQRRRLQLTAIWLTHGHLDHAGGVVAFCAQQPVPVFGPHQEDDYLLDYLPESTRQFGFPISPSFRPERFLQEGEKLYVGNYAFEVLHVPGHTPGHVVFYCEDAKLLIAGDVLFYESIGRTDFPKGDHVALLTHIRNKLYTLPDDVRVIPGHGRMTTIGHEKHHNPHVRAS